MKYFLLLILPFSLFAQEPPTGITFAGLPTMSYSSGEGLSYGGRLFMYQYGKGDKNPYEYTVSFNLTQSTKNRVDLFLFLDVPHILGPDTRFDLYMEYRKLVYDDFYGIGNDIVYNRGLKEPDSPDYIDEYYYTYQHKWKAIMANFQYPLRLKKGLKALTGYGLYYTTIAQHDSPSRFKEILPFGLDGGYTGYARMGLVLDRRDNEAITTSGYWSEIIFERAAPLFGSDFNYSRLTLTDRRYFALHPRLVYAQRLIYETMPGNPPFYEMTVISGSYMRREGLGGAYSLRGVPRFLFVGPDKFIANMELRFKVKKTVILKQNLTFYLHGFVDAGRVWTKDQSKSLKNLTFTQGLGFHIKWKKDFVASLDIGRSRYRDFGIYTSFGNLF